MCIDPDWLSTGLVVLRNWIYIQCGPTVHCLSHPNYVKCSRQPSNKSIYGSPSQRKTKQSVMVRLPRPARSLAVSLPIPTLAPVTIAVFPSSRTSEDHLGINRDLKKVGIKVGIRQIFTGNPTPNTMLKSRRGQREVSGGWKAVYARCLLDPAAAKLQGGRRPSASRKTRPVPETTVIAWNQKAVSRFCIFSPVTVQHELMQHSES